MPLIGLQGREGATGAGREESTLQWPILGQASSGVGRQESKGQGGQDWCAEQRGDIHPKSEGLLQE